MYFCRGREEWRCFMILVVGSIMTNWSKKEEHRNYSFMCVSWHLHWSCPRRDQKLLHFPAPHKVLRVYECYLEKRILRSNKWEESA